MYASQLVDICHPAYPGDLSAPVLKPQRLQVLDLVLAFVQLVLLVLGQALEQAKGLGGGETRHSLGDISNSVKVKRGKLRFRQSVRGIVEPGSMSLRLLQSGFSQLSFFRQKQQFEK
jgi:hypothetical protein